MLIIVLVATAALPQSAWAARTWSPLERLTPVDRETGAGDAVITSADAQVLAYTQAPQDDAPYPDLYARVRPATGAFGPAQLLGHSALYPAVATDGLGGTHVAWEHDPLVGDWREGQRVLISSAGPDGVFGPAVDLGQGQSQVAVAANARGDVVVSWYRYRDEGRRLLAA